MLRELTGEDQTNGGLDLSGRQSLLLVVSDQFDSLLSDLVEDIVDERVHDTHGLLRDTGIRVNLLEDLEDVNSEVLSSLATSLSFLINDICTYTSFLNIRLLREGAFRLSSCQPWDAYRQRPLF